MRKNMLRVLGLMLVAWAVMAAGPVKRANAQTCACTFLCIRGDFCCATQLSGGCHQQCEDNRDACPSACFCTLDCIVGKHCCTGITSDGVCTQTCIDNSLSCSS